MACYMQLSIVFCIELNNIITFFSYLKVPSCFVEGEIRLRGGTTAREGRVEICLGGVWGTVCDNGWGTTDARVVCRQLGYPTIGIFLYFHLTLQFKLLICDHFLQVPGRFHLHSLAVEVVQS